MEEFGKIVNDVGLAKKICNLYTYFNTYRHGLFHIDEMVVTSKVLTLAEANNIITTALTLIDDCHDCL